MIMTQATYVARFTREDGVVVAEFPDISSSIVEGRTYNDALSKARECLRSYLLAAKKKGCLYLNQKQEEMILDLLKTAIR